MNSEASDAIKLYLLLRLEHIFNFDLKDNKMTTQSQKRVDNAKQKMEKSDIEKAELFYHEWLEGSCQWPSLEAQKANDMDDIN